MRILVVAPGPSFSVADVQRGWTRALERLGHEVRTYNLDDRLSFFASGTFGEHQLDSEQAVRLAIEPLGNVCYRYWPDVILVVTGTFVPNDLWDVWKHRPHKTVLLCTESPYEDDRQFEQMMFGEPDVMLINDPINLNRFREYHDHVYYAPHAYDPEIHTPGAPAPQYVCDFGFVGTGYPSRRDLFARVDWRGIDIKLAGMWEGVRGTCLEPFVIHELKHCFDNADAVDLYRSTKVSANLYRASTGAHEANDPRLREGWAVGPREIELAATRTFFLREPRPEGDELFMLPTFTEAGEFEDLLRYYLKHDHEREVLVDQAQEAIQDRTFDAHARRLMQVLPD